jgi:allantoicase
VDTNHFKGNYPDTCSLEACDLATDGSDVASWSSLAWREVLRRTKLQAHTRHHFEDEIGDAGATTHLRFNIYPDGGVSRLRVYCEMDAEGR